MPKHQTELYGDAKTMAAKLLKGASADLVREFNKRYPVYGRVLLGNVGPERFAAAGLGLNAAGRLILVGADVVSPQPAPVPASAAAAIFDARLPHSPTVHASSTLQIHAYGQRVAPRQVRDAWTTSGVDARLDMVRAAPGFLEGEISRIPHKGKYQGDNGFEKVGRQVGRIVSKLCAPPLRPDSPIKWGFKATPGDVTYSVNVDHASQAAVVRTEHFGDAIEVGAALSYTGTSARFPSHGRLFSLTGQTVFTADDLVDQLVDISLLPPGEEMQLVGDDASFVAECVDGQDLGILAPAYTSVTIAQQVLGVPHVQQT